MVVGAPVSFAGLTFGLGFHLWLGKFEGEFLGLEFGRSVSGTFGRLRLGWGRGSWRYMVGHVLFLHLALGEENFIVAKKGLASLGGRFERGPNVLVEERRHRLSEESRKDRRERLSRLGMFHISGVRGGPPRNHSSTPRRPKRKINHLRAKAK